MQQKIPHFSNNHSQIEFKTLNKSSIRRSQTPGRTTVRISLNDNQNVYNDTNPSRFFNQNLNSPYRIKSNRFVDNSLPLKSKQNQFKNYSFQRSSRLIKESAPLQRNLTPEFQNKESQFKRVSTKSTKPGINNQKTRLFNTDEDLYFNTNKSVGCFGDIDFLNKEIYELQKQLNAEKEQNKKLIELGKNELICIEEVEVKKVYGKKNEIKQQLQNSKYLSERNLILEKELQNKDLIISQLKQDLQKKQNLQNNKSQVYYVQETKETNEKIIVEKERNDRYLKNIGELQQLQKNLKNQLEQKFLTEKRLNDKLNEQEKLLLFYKQKSDRKFQNNQSESSQINHLKEQLSLKDRLIADLKYQNNQLSQKLTFQQKMIEQESLKDQEIQNLKENLKNFNSILNQRDDEILTLNEQLQSKENEQQFIQRKIQVGAVNNQQVQNLMNSINEKNQLIEKLQDQFDKLSKQKQIQNNLENMKNSQYQSIELQYKEELDKLQIDKSYLQNQIQEQLRLFNYFKDQIQKEINKISGFEDQKQNSFQQSIVQFETQEVQENTQFNSLTSENYNTKILKEDIDNLIQQVKKYLKKNQKPDQNQIKQTKYQEEEIKKQLEQIKILNQELLNFFSKIRIQVLDIIRELPEETGIKIFFESLEKDQQIGEHLRQKLKNILKIIETYCLKINEHENENCESFSVDMEVKKQNLHFQSSNNLQSLNLKKENEVLGQFNNQLSEKILNLYQKIAYLENQLEQHKNNSQNLNNEKFLELTAEIERIRKQRDEIQQKEMNLRRKIENKRKSMLSELNSFVKTKKQFEQSFLSELTKTPNSNQQILLQ